MSIAVLAWGSLIWDRRGLEIVDDFQSDGPSLQVEFARVSRDGRLTLVIDESLGAACTAYSAVSAIGDLNAAIENLRVREGLPGVRSVGFVDVASGKQSESAMKRHPHSVAAIRAWAQANGYDAAIWTALASNFHEPDKAGEPLSVEAAIRYLDALEAPKLATALAYIRNAPPDVQTPVRAAVSHRWPEG